MDFTVGREFKDTVETSDARRVEHQPLWKALRNVKTAAEWFAALFKLEPHQVHVTKTDVIEESGAKKVLLEGVAHVGGEIIRLSTKVDGEKPYQPSN